jgi:hypothetical protein
MMESVSYNIPPSKFAFMDCPRCFWLERKHKVKLPGGPFPKVFNVLDDAQKTFTRALHTSSVKDNIPAGECLYHDEWVKSEAVEFPRYGVNLTIRGKFDTVVKLDDGNFMVIDFKTTIPNSGTLPKYLAQLTAYAYALENPLGGALNKHIAPVTQVGILAFEPGPMRLMNGKVVYETRDGVCP